MTTTCKADKDQRTKPHYHSCEDVCLVLYGHLHGAVRVRSHLPTQYRRHVEGKSLTTVLSCDLRGRCVNVSVNDSTE